jgi:hypothetical protein
VTRIRATDERGPAAFGMVVDVAIDPLCRVWVADGLDQKLTVFGADGRFVRSIGRKGSGPAEFRGIAGFAWAPDGTLWVLDAGNSRFAVFDTAGRLRETHPRTASITVTPWPGGFDRRGRLADLASQRRMGAQTFTTLVRIDPGGERDTLSLPPIEELDFGEITGGSPANRTVKRAPVPFTPMRIWAMDPEGYAWVAVTDRYRVERRRFDGSIERTLELDHPPRRVSSADKERILRSYRWFEDAGGRLDADRIPDWHPQLQSLFFDDEGHLWIAPTYVNREAPRLDVFDVDGTFLGQVQAPAPLLTTPSPAFRAGWVAAVVRGADGDDSILLMRLRKPGT